MAHKFMIDEDGQAHIEFVSPTREELEAEFRKTLELEAFCIGLVVEYFYNEDNRAVFIQTVRVKNDLLTIKSVSAIMMDEIKHQIRVYELVEEQSTSCWFTVNDVSYLVNYMYSPAFAAQGELPAEPADVLIRTVQKNGLLMEVSKELHDQLEEAIIEHHS